MKTLITMLPWWSAVLLFLNIALAALVLRLRSNYRAFESLVMLRVYLWYSFFGGIAFFIALCVTPIGRWWYWYIMNGINLAFDVVLFLFCAQVVDIAIHRREVALVKKVFLVLCPVILGIVVAWNRIYPFLHIGQSLKFDLAFAVASGAVLLFSWQKPPDLGPEEIWIGDYSRIVQGLAVQLAAICGLKLFTFPSVAGEIVAALAPLVTLALFGIAVRQSAVKENAA